VVFPYSNLPSDFIGQNYYKKDNKGGMPIKLRNYGRNHKKRKEYIQQSRLLLVLSQE